jgi:hypothetical protein
LTVSLTRRQIDDPNSQIGQKPTVINCDGHDSNVRNEELIELAEKNKINLWAPPAHTSAARLTSKN